MSNTDAEKLIVLVQNNAERLSVRCESEDKPMSKTDLIGELDLLALLIRNLAIVLRQLIPKED